MSIAAISVISIIAGIICLLIISIDLISRPQIMWIMNIVWPVTALYSGPLGLLLYFYIGRQVPKEKMESQMQGMQGMKENHMQSHSPFWQSVLKGALHCGSGCTLGDLISGWLLLIIPVTILGSKLIGDWIIEYVLAFAIGIIFQYYAIKPMKNLSSGDAFKAALKADTLSLTFWQIGMYGWMAIANFLIFHHRLDASTPVYWFMMQIGMLCGLVTAYPINWLLIKKGVKEAM